MKLSPLKIGDKVIVKLKSKSVGFTHFGNRWITGIIENIFPATEYSSLTYWINPDNSSHGIVIENSDELFRGIIIKKVNQGKIHGN